MKIMTFIILLSLSIVHYSFAMKKEVIDLERFKEQIKNCSSNQEKITLAEKKIKQYKKKRKKYKKMKKKVEKKERTIEVLTLMIGRKSFNDFSNFHETPTYDEAKMQKERNENEEIELVDLRKKEIEEVNSQKKLEFEKEESGYKERIYSMQEELQKFKNKFNQVKSEKKLLKSVADYAHKIKEETMPQVKKDTRICCWWS